MAYKAYKLLAQDAPEDEPYWAVMFPDGSWMRLSLLIEICDFDPFLLEWRQRSTDHLPSCRLPLIGKEVLQSATECYRTLQKVG